MNTKTLFIQIGFNKCATSAFHKLFRRSGYQALHGGGRVWRRVGHPAVVGRNVQIEIDANVRAGRPAFSSFEDFNAFFDMEYQRENAPPVENFRHFAVFARDYPHAKFLLNTRDKAAWLRSRARHADGRYMRLARARTGLEESGVIDMWAEDFDRHHDAVRRFFAAEPDRFLEFNVDETPVEELIAFAGNDIPLRKRFWEHVRVTDEVAKVADWRTEADIPANRSKLH